MRASFRVISLVVLTAALAAASANAGGVGALGGADTLQTIVPPGYIPNYASRDTFIVVGKKVTLREIMRRAVAGERGKLSGHHDMTYTMTARNIVLWNDKMKVEEAVLRAYADADGNNRTVVLEEKTTDYDRGDGDEWVEKEDEDDEPAPIRVSAGGIEDFSRIAFFLESEHEFDFALLERVLEDDKVIFKIAFRPKSDFKPLPSGIVYVETPDYRIMHEEFRFDKNPFPLFLKGVNRVSRHWTVLPGGECVFSKILIEAEIRSDPFGYIPHKVTAALVRDDFQFDQGYDERLFGELEDAPVTAPPTARVDTTASISRDGMIGRLQQEDESFYPRDLLTVDTAHRDHVISQHDSLGLKGLQIETERQIPLLRPNAGLATNLIGYNRVEGLLAGLSGRLRGRDDEDSPSLSVEGAYATGSEKFRHFEELTIPRVDGRWRSELRLSYSDKVVPYGSNRPTANGLRMLIGGEDKQDYMRREGGGGGVFVRHRSGLNLGAAYERHRVHSVEGTTDFCFFGELKKFNAPISEGTESAVVVSVGYEPEFPARFEVGVTQRLAGGPLGEDFEYLRTDTRIGARHYVFGRHEVDLQLLYVATAADVPDRQWADVGGISTVRGYPRRWLVGESSLAARLEYLVPYDILGDARIPFVSSLGLQLVPWADAARVWEGNSEDWIHSAGFGVQFFLGAFGRASNLRFDFAFPTADDPPQDFRFEVRLAPGGF